MSWIEDLVAHISEWSSWLKILSLSLSVAIEYVFPIFPGDTVVLLAGFLKAKGAFDLKEIFLCIILGSLLGSFLAYEAGRIIARNNKNYQWVIRLKNSEAFNKFNHWYHRFGPLFLLFNRFFHGIRAIFFVSAGMINLPLWQVLALGGLSAVIYNCFLVLVGYWLGYNAEAILDYFYSYSLAFYILIAFSLSIFLVYLWHKRKNRL
jgi:membrane protein DedA with SNARE-associated domain